MKLWTDKEIRDYKEAVLSGTPPNHITPNDYFCGPIDYTSAELKLSEKKIENKGKQWARDHGWHVRKWSAPGNSGVPDDIFVRNGFVVFIEFKRVGKEPTGLQCDEAEQLLNAGAKVHWVNTLRGLKGLLSAYHY